MRLWHYKLIPHLDRQRLLSQHRECCALRGKGWGKKHATVNYVFNHQYDMLFNYHMLVMTEMKNRGYNITAAWLNKEYRGQILNIDTSDFTQIKENGMYPEHNDQYYNECLQLLIEKTKDIDNIDYTFLLN